jgi:hypothetical protein
MLLGTSMGGARPKAVVQETIDSTKSSLIRVADNLGHLP